MQSEKCRGSFASKHFKCKELCGTDKSVPYIYGAFSRPETFNFTLSIFNFEIIMYEVEYVFSCWCYQHYC